MLRYIPGPADSRWSIVSSVHFKSTWEVCWRYLACRARLNVIGQLVLNALALAHAATTVKQTAWFHTVNNRCSRDSRGGGRYHASPQISQPCARRRCIRKLGRALPDEAVVKQTQIPRWRNRSLLKHLLTLGLAIMINLRRSMEVAKSTSQREPVCEPQSHSEEHASRDGDIANKAETS